MAHQDVVPIAPGTERRLAGRARSPARSRTASSGAAARWDDKGNLIVADGGHRDAASPPASSRGAPIYLVFGADEEVGGLRGALPIADAAQAERGVTLDFVIDEGLLITEGVLPGLATPAALVGVAEKGYLSVALQRRAPRPGHSSMPPPRARARSRMMSAALTRLDEQPDAGRASSGVAREMFDTLAPEMSGFNRVALSNLWLFGPLVQAAARSRRRAPTRCCAPPPR